LCRLLQPPLTCCSYSMILSAERLHPEDVVLHHICGRRFWVSRSTKPWSRPVSNLERLIGVVGWEISTLLIKWDCQYIFRLVQKVFA
jgi:hypothetical protein